MGQLSGMKEARLMTDDEDKDRTTQQQQQKQKKAQEMSSMSLGPLVFFFSSHFILFLLIS
jgi:uncharacterized membrane protein (DUF106 family)